ncbi:MAG: rod shape-determining protein [Candidatus Spechtbacterales bacterium]|nr:rod shape-determining protein [Candidatus Spechtbacterales bacterium]
MLNKILGNFSQDIGIDLGTANTLVYVGKKGIVINEPSVVAINQKTGRVLAIGEEARRMVGKTPAHIVASRPLVDGVVSDFEITQQMLKYFIDKVHSSDPMRFLPRPRVVVGIPSGVTEVEKRAVEDAAKAAGAREVYLIDEPMAAAIGARLDVQEPHGSMIIDIGGGTTEVAVISLGGIVVARSLRIAGDRLNEDIINYARDEFNLLLGERTAETIKMEIGSSLPVEEPLTYPMRGRDLISGLPKEIIVEDKHIRAALASSVEDLTEAIKGTVEQTPPELLADIMEKGIVLAGGGSLLRGFDQLIQKETQIPVHITEDPLTAVARGTGIVLEDLDQLKEVLVDMNYNDKPPGFN